MKKIVLGSLVFFGMLAAASGAMAEGHKIAIVNLPAILRESTAAKGIKEQIDNKRDTYQNQIKKQEEKLSKEEQEIKNQVSVLSAEALDKKKKDFLGKVADVKRSAQEKMGQLQKAYATAMGDVQKTMFDIIKDLSKEKGFDVAIPTTSLLYGKEELDISQDVLERLNKKLPKVTVTMEEKESSSKKD